MTDPIPRPVEDNWNESRPEPGLPQILFVLIVGIASFLIFHFVTGPRVRRFATYDQAVAAGMTVGADPPLSPYVPPVASDIVHGGDVSARGSRNYHWIVVTVPSAATVLVRA